MVAIEERCLKHRRWRDYQLAKNCEECRKKRREYARKWRNKKENRKKSAEYTRISNLRNKIRVIKMLGGKCVNCGITDIRILVVNHKYGGGSKHRKKGWNSQPIYRRILRGEFSRSDYDIRCYNCNILYEYERGKISLPDMEKVRKKL